jgi:hypothetical protein
MGAYKPRYGLPSFLDAPLWQALLFTLQNTQEMHLNGFFLDGKHIKNKHIKQGKIRLS